MPAIVDNSDSANLNIHDNQIFGQDDGNNILYLTGPNPTMSNNTVTVTAGNAVGVKLEPAAPNQVFTWVNNHLSVQSGAVGVILNQNATDNATFTGGWINSPFSHGYGIYASTPGTPQTGPGIAISGVLITGFDQATVIDKTAHPGLRMSTNPGLQDYPAAGALASLSYDPIYTTVNTSGTTLAAVDAANLRVTFTAPSSGKVIVTLSAVAGPVSSPRTPPITTGASSMRQAAR